MGIMTELIFLEVSVDLNFSRISAEMINPEPENIFSKLAEFGSWVEQISAKIEREASAKAMRL